MPYLKQCSCCRRTFTAEQWGALELRGQQKVEAFEDEPEEILELRNCNCGSTIAITWVPPFHRAREIGLTRAIAEP